MSGNRRTQNDVGVYVRKSSEKQSDLSLPAQERIIRQRILEPAGVSRYTLYPDILSGTRPDRTGYQQMLADARAGKLRLVVFHKVNRFGRNAAEGLMAIEELRKLGIEVRIADLPTLDIRTPEGMFIFTFLLGQGQYEVENLGSEARKGMKEKFERGGWPFLAPDGYKNCREEIAPRKFLASIAVDRHRAAIVRLIYRWYATGTTTLIATSQRLNRLHDQRIARGKSGCACTFGGRWRPAAVYRILNNRFYIGEIEVPSWGSARQGSHSPLISRALFDRVQQIMAQHAHGPMQRHGYLLQGLLWLDGAIMMRCTTVMQGGRPYTYYFRYTESGQRAYLHAQPIEDQVVGQIRGLVSTLGEAPAATLQRRLGTHIAALRRNAQERMEGLSVERRRILHFARKERFTEAEVAAEMNRLETEQAWAERELVYAQQIETMHETLLAEAGADVAALARWSGCRLRSSTSSSRG